MHGFNPSSTTIQRDALYEQVWSTPMIKLAKQYGISDVGLAKACKRHNIPRPPVGYWARRAAGQTPPKAPLPPNRDPALETVRFDGAYSGELQRLASADAANPVNPAKPGAQSSANKTHAIVVSDRLSKPHPLVEAARLRFRANSNHGAAHGVEDAGLAIRVGQKSLGRALRIMDALIKHWESLGGTVGVGTSNYNRRAVNDFKIGEDQVKVIIEEVAGDRLALKVDTIWSDRLRCTWQDGKRQRLEDVLDSFVNGALLHIARKKRERLDNACQARQRQRMAERRARAEQVKKDEETRRTQLLNEIERWHRARSIREYLQAIQMQVDGGDITPADPEHLQRWVEWASWYADVLDPLADAGTSPYPSVPPKPVNTPIDDLDLTERIRPIIEALGITDSDALYRVDRKALRNAARDGADWPWSEICRVLDGLGYDVSDRQFWP